MGEKWKVAQLFHAARLLSLPHALALSLSFYKCGCVCRLFLSVCVYGCVWLCVCNCQLVGAVSPNVEINLFQLKLNFCGFITLPELPELCQSCARATHNKRHSRCRPAVTGLPHYLISILLSLYIYIIYIPYISHNQMAKLLPALSLSTHTIIAFSVYFPFSCPFHFLPSACTLYFLRFLSFCATSIELTWDQQLQQWQVPLTFVLIICCELSDSDVWQLCARPFDSYLICTFPKSKITAKKYKYYWNSAKLNETAARVHGMVGQTDMTVPWTMISLAEY